jgi:spore germination cell wall hydrolase CwlJ-like protein
MPVAALVLRRWLAEFGMRQLRVLALAAVSGATLSGCAVLSPFAYHSPKECLMRAMYFESNRSSEEGMLAVGTVVMNRVADGRYPKTVCGVVGQPNQFAPGVLSKPMKEGRPKQLAARVADRVLAGARHPAVPPRVQFFHTAGLRFPYNNMHYVLEAGGNEFYEKRSRR